MGIFGSKSLVWVPENEKLKEKILEVGSWQAKESFIGWKICNDGSDLMKAVGACDSCSNFDFSYNGLGDKEATTLAAALKRNFERNRKPPGQGNWGTIVKLNLSNNHIHALGIKALCDSLLRGDPRERVCLEELILANNHAGPEGATAVGSVLSKNRVIKKVNLQWNNIGNAGINAICMALGPHSKSCKVNISFNHFDVSDPDVEWEEIPSHLSRVIGKPFSAVLVGWDDCPLTDLH
mmetsp:Transcript_67566/g.161288  ORF Transcript_67566/g.161288 Transcript_67566/m.161288 type:complete len:237 (-) Transcript_67566:697-1407(-)